MIFTDVDPEMLINPRLRQPPNGRGAWTRSGIGFDYRYAINPAGAPRIGTTASLGLAEWAVAAGCYTIQTRLVQLGHMAPVGAREMGCFGPRTREAVEGFQSHNSDPDGGTPLVVDGTVGRSDARSLFTPLIDEAEVRHRIPDRWLRGECAHESALDPGAVGYYIYYSSGTAYRGVDRGAFQINALANKHVGWVDAYDFGYAADWSAKRMRAYYDLYAERYPASPEMVLWEAAVLAHNNPAAAGTYARTGIVSSASAAAYIAGVKTARY